MDAKYYRQTYQPELERAQNTAYDYYRSSDYAYPASGSYDSYDRNRGQTHPDAHSAYQRPQADYHAQSTRESDYYRSDYYRSEPQASRNEYPKDDYYTRPKQYPSNDYNYSRTDYSTSRRGSVETTSYYQDRQRDYGQDYKRQPRNDRSQYKENHRPQKDRYDRKSVSPSRQRSYSTSHSEGSTARSRGNSDGPQSQERKRGYDKKEEVCKFFRSGSCHKGELCTYSHDLKKDACVFYHMKRSGCNKGRDCPFSHAPMSFKQREKIMEDLVEYRKKFADYKQESERRESETKSDDTPDQVKSNLVVEIKEEDDDEDTEFCVLPVHTESNTENANVESSGQPTETYFSDNEELI